MRRQKNTYRVAPAEPAPIGADQEHAAADLENSATSNLVDKEEEENPARRRYRRLRTYTADRDFITQLRQAAKNHAASPKEQAAIERLAESAACREDIADLHPLAERAGLDLRNILPDPVMNILLETAKENAEEAENIYLDLERAAATGNRQAHDLWLQEYDKRIDQAKYILDQAENAGPGPQPPNQAQKVTRKISNILKNLAAYRSHLPTFREQRQLNPGYSVPGETVRLGAVLDLDVQRHQYKYGISEFKGWHMLSGANASDTRPGYARLYLLPGRLTAIDANPSEQALDTFDTWHRRQPDKFGELETPEHIGYYQGRVLRIGYRSDKWGRRPTDYDHDFLETGTPPRIYTDTPRIEDAKAAVLVGGNFTITRRGIE